MSGVPKIEISESRETLKCLRKQQKTGLGFAKVQALYLLKIQAVETVRHLAMVLGRGEATIHRWLHLYKEGGVEKLLEEKPKTGRPKKLPVETVAKLQQELRDREGFSSYQEVRNAPPLSCWNRVPAGSAVKIWGLAIENIIVSYGTIHRVVRYELQAKLKVARPLSKKQNPGDPEGFKNQRVSWLKTLNQSLSEQFQSHKKISYWRSPAFHLEQVQGGSGCQDETRLG
jgi:hypothetical protein